jgi:hypothetical protein
MVRNRVLLKSVREPLIGSFVTALPILVASDYTMDDCCGVVGRPLHTEEGQVHGVTILCADCGFNQRDDKTRGDRQSTVCTHHGS